MVSVRDQVRLGFRELGLEHEADWVWDHVRQETNDFFTAQSLAQNIIDRRKNGEPLAYILGRWPFLNVTLKVAPGVLIPRPETEELADLVVKLITQDAMLARKSTLKILDLGAGSGALGIGVSDALLSALSSLSVELHSVERSRHAHPILLQNLEMVSLRHGRRMDVREHFISWNDLPTSLGNFDVILGNPPYISPAEWSADVDNSVKNFEPQVALIPEAPTTWQLELASLLALDSLDLEKLALGPLLENLHIAKSLLLTGGLFAIEIGPAQGNTFENLWRLPAEEQFKVRLRVVRDLSSKLRFLIGNSYG